MKTQTYRHLDIRHPNTWHKEHRQKMNRVIMSNKIYICPCEQFCESDKNFHYLKIMASVMPPPESLYFKKENITVG